METFHEFYGKLYKAGSNDSKAHMNSFLYSLPLPKLETRHRDELEAPISVDEVLFVIKNLKQGSAPGPGGFSTLYYKTYAQTLAPHLACFFNSKTSGDPLDRQLNVAFISMIPKPKTLKRSKLQTHFLINNDLKIMTKILANRMVSFIGLYVHKDQVGPSHFRQGPVYLYIYPVYLYYNRVGLGRTIEKDCSLRLTSKKPLILSHGLICSTLCTAGGLAISFWDSWRCSIPPQKHEYTFRDTTRNLK